MVSIIFSRPSSGRRADARMRRQAHAFLAAGDDDLAVASSDLLRRQRHGAQARAADLVDRARPPIPSAGRP
jgi:hypothetical protein